MSETIFLTATIVSVLASLVSYIFSVLKRARRRKVVPIEVSEGTDELASIGKSLETMKMSKKDVQKILELVASSKARPTKPMEPEDLTRRPYYVTIMIFLFVAITTWLFYLRDGIEGAKLAWSFSGPLMGAIAGFWLSRVESKA